MNKKSIKKLNYRLKTNVFLDGIKFLIKSKIEQHWVEMFNYRIAMSSFMYGKETKNKKINWRL